MVELSTVGKRLPFLPRCPRLPPLLFVFDAEPNVQLGRGYTRMWLSLKDNIVPHVTLLSSRLSASEDDIVGSVCEVVLIRVVFLPVSLRI